MKNFRIVVGILALLPLSLLVDNLFFHPQFYGEGSLGELVYLLFGVPIFTLNFWAWAYPEIIEFYFLGMEKQPQS